MTLEPTSTRFCVFVRQDPRLLGPLPPGSGDPDPGPPGSAGSTSRSAHRHRQVSPCQVRGHEVHHGVQGQGPAGTYHA
jgi:hypothetical protein